MRSKRYTEEQILRILQEIESGKTVAETCRKYGVAERAMPQLAIAAERTDKVHLRRLKELEQENTRLKKIVAQQVLDIDALKDLLGKEW